MSLGGNVAKSTVVIDTSQAERNIQRLQQTIKNLDASLQSSGRSATGIANAFTKTEQKINSVTSNFNKLNQTVTTTTKQQLNLQQSFTKTGQSATQAGQKISQMDKNVATMGKNFNASVNPIKNSGNALNNISRSAETTGSKMSKMGSFMKNNLTNVSLLAGGLAGLDDQFLALHKAQVANERANLMKEKSDQQVRKTQEALNKMVAKGQTGTADYALKLKDLELAQDKAGIAAERQTVTQENLNERTEDFWIGILPNMIFVGGSAMSMIKDMGINMGTLTGAMGKLRGGVGTLVQSLGSSGGLVGVLGAVGIAALGAIAIIKTVEGQVQKFYDTIKAKPRTNATVLDAIFDWKGFVQKSKEGTAEVDEILSRTGTTMAEFALAPELVGKRFLEMGGKINEAGQIAITAKDHFFDLGLGIYGVGKSSVQYIHWAQVMIEQDGNSARAKKFLADSGMSQEAQQKALTLAIKDAQPALQALTQDEITYGKVISVNIESLADYDAALHTSSAQSTTGVSKAKQYTDTLSGFNNKLVETAMGLNVNSKVLADNTAKTTDGTEAIITKNQNLRLAINAAKGHTVVTEENTKAIIASNEAFKEQVDSITNGANAFERDMDLATRLGQAQKNLAEATKNATSFINDQLTGVFEKFKTPTKELDKKLKKDLNKTFEVFPKLKTVWKDIGKTEEIRTRLQEKIKGLFERNPITGFVSLRMDTKKMMKDKDWDKWGKDLMGIIDKKIAAGSPEMAGLKQKIQEAINSPDSAHAFQELMNTPEFIELINPTMEVTIAQDSLTKLQALITKSMENAFTNYGKGYMVQADLSGVPGGTQYTDDQKDKIWADEEVKGGWRYHKTPIGTKKKGSHGETMVMTSNGWKTTMPADTDQNDPGSWTSIDSFLNYYEHNKSGNDPENSNDSTGVTPFDLSKDQTQRRGWMGISMASRDIEGYEAGLYGDPNAAINKKGIGEKMGEQSSPFAATAVGAQELQTAFANLATQGTASMVLLAKNTQAQLSFINTYLTKIVSVGAQTMQTSLANLAVQGSGSMIMLAKNSQAQLSFINTYLTGIVAKGSQALQTGLANLAIQGSGSMIMLAKNSQAQLSFINTYLTTIATVGAQTFQTALGSLARYGSKNMQGLAKTSKTSFNTVANYADGATTAIQTDQTAINSLAKLGSKNLVALGKSSKTNFNTVANYSDGATDHVQTLQTAINSMAKFGIKNMKAVAKESSSMANGMSNNFDKAITAAHKLADAIRAIPSGGGGTRGGGGGTKGRNAATGGLFQFESEAAGDIKTVSRPTMFLYGDNPGHQETLAFIPHNNPQPTLEKLTRMFGGAMASMGSSGIAGGGTVHIHNHFLQREVQQVLNVERGRMISRMG